MTKTELIDQLRRAKSMPEIEGAFNRAGIGGYAKRIAVAQEAHGDRKIYELEYCRLSAGDRYCWEALELIRKNKNNDRVNLQN